MSDHVLTADEIPWGNTIAGRGLGPTTPASVAPAESAPRKSQATRLVDLALAAGVELWQSSAGDAYATLRVGDHREHHPLRRIVRDYCTRLYYADTGRAASSAALTDALGTLAGMARFGGPTHPIGVRLASHEGTLYLDLGDPDWRAVAIDADGWRVVGETPVRCWRPASLRALPVPIGGGSLDALREVFPLADDTWALVASWAVAALAPRGPYPILIEAGECGSGKSTLGRMLRGLIDPAAPELRGVPRDERDVMIGALRSHVVALDNLSGLPAWLSDALCRIATGGGFAARTLYSDLDETVIDVMRPILLTGIESPATRGDLADRALVVTLPAIADRARGDETDLWRRYHARRPALLGALCDAASTALRRVTGVELARWPRMADACRWATASEPALGWTAGRTVAAWLGARAATSADLLADDPIGLALSALPVECWPWTGTAADLLVMLGARVSEAARTARQWPRSPRGLSGALRRLAPDLRRGGLVVALPTDARTARERLITIRRSCNEQDTQDQPDGSADRRGDSADVRCPVDTAGGLTGQQQDVDRRNESGLASDLSDLSGPSQADLKAEERWLDL